jgi:hypothetical protein
VIRINSYDIDGVLYLGPKYEGLNPGTEDVIITGRSFEQRAETLQFLRGRGIQNMVFFNPMSRNDLGYGRVASGIHKANVIKQLYDLDIEVVLHFEDDPVQREEIEKSLEKSNAKAQVILLDTYEKLGIFTQ